MITDSNVLAQLIKSDWIGIIKATDLDLRRVIGGDSHHTPNIASRSTALTLHPLIATIVVFTPRPVGPEGVLSSPSCAAAAAHTLLTTTPTWFNRLNF